MSTDATQGMGADVADLESMFADEPGESTQVEQQTQNQTGTDTQTQKPAAEVVVELDEEGNPIDSEIVELDEDGNPVVVETEVEVVDENTPAELVIPDDHKVKLTIDGKEVEYTFGDLKAGVQKAEGADKRFAEAAAIRKEYTDKSQNLVTREGQLAQVLEYYIGQAQQTIEKEPNWAELIASDPQKYLVERHNWEQKQSQLLQARQVQENLRRQEAERQEASNQQRVQEAKAKLQTAIPEWADPKKAAEGAIAIDRYLHDQGIAPEMRAAIDSAEVLVIARKAMLYDQAIAAAKARKGKPAAAAQQAQGQQPAARQQAARQQTRVERPGAATAAQTQASRQNISRVNANKRFEANPSVDTLAGFFE